MRNLRLLTMTLGAVISAIGLFGIVAPSALLEFGRSLQTPSALYVVAVVRVAFGAVLVWVASASRMPTVLRLIGTIIIVTGLLTPSFGVERAQALLTWWSRQGPLFMHAWPILAVLFGVFLIYVVYPRRRLPA